MGLRTTYEVAFEQSGAAGLRNTLTELNQGLEIAKKAGRALQATFEFAKAGAQLRDIEASFRRMGGTAPGLERMSKALGQAVSKRNIQQMSNMAVTLGITSDNFEKLLPIARAASIALGQDVTKSLTDLTTATARGSKKIADNLGLMVDFTGAADALALSLGKTTKELTAAEQAQSRVNAVMAAGQTLMATAPVDAYAESFSRVTANIDDTTDALAKLTSEALASPFALGALGEVGAALERARFVKTGQRAKGQALLAANTAREARSLEGLDFGSFAQQFVELGRQVGALGSAVARTATARPPRKGGTGGAQQSLSQFVGGLGPAGGQGLGAIGGGPGLGTGLGAILGEEPGTNFFQALTTASQDFFEVATEGFGELSEAISLSVAESNNLDAIFQGTLISGAGAFGEAIAQATIANVLFGKSFQGVLNAALQALFIEAAAKAAFHGAAAIGAAAIGGPFATEAVGKNIAAAKAYAFIAAGAGLGTAITGGFKAPGGGSAGGGGGRRGSAFGGGRRDFGEDFGRGGNQTTIINAAIEVDGVRLARSVITHTERASRSRGI